MSPFRVACVTTASLENSPTCKFKSGMMLPWIHAHTAFTISISNSMVLSAIWDYS